ncbi:MAG TPA: cytochrome bd-I oxidase subunit CydX [Methylocella sp.]|nr:cytochrome bd-I oxidase subunit CydX [Methylocella sp.]
MWYFSWVLGVSFAISFSIINALWLEAQESNEARQAEEGGRY